MINYNCASFFIITLWVKFLLGNQKKVNQLLQYVMILIRHYHQMTCKHKGIFNLLEMKSNLFGKNPMG